MWLYHATFRSNLKSIKENGLGAKQPKNWDFSTDGVVCLCSDPDVAFSFCECADHVSESKYNSGIVVLLVDGRQLDRANFGTDCNIKENTPGIMHFIYKGVIPSNLLYVTSKKPGSRFIGPLPALKRVPSYE